jgi:hypothetical protein
VCGLFCVSPPGVAGAIPTLRFRLAFFAPALDPSPFSQAAFSTLRRLLPLARAVPLTGHTCFFNIL